MMARYGVPATRVRWYNTQTQRAPGMTALAAKSLMVPLGMIVDAFRIGTWVRRHDVVMVPGMGVLETSLPILHSLLRHLAMSRLSQEWSALVLWTITTAMTTVGRRISFMPPTLRR